MWSSESIEWIDIELTSFCNIDCPGCFRQVKRKKVNDILDKDNLTLKQIKKWVTKKNFPNCKLINFCGSIDEPTLHPELLEILDWFKGIDVNISSNGSTKTTKFWSNLGERKISVFFGIDGIDQESLQKYRIGSNFKKVLENAQRMAKEEGFDNFRLIYSHRSDNKESKKIKRDEEQTVVCKYGEQNRLFISHTGVMLPCCFLNSEFLQTYATNESYTDFQHMYENTGGLLTNSLKYSEPDEIMNGDLFNSIIKSWSSKPISRCWSTCKKAKQDVFLGEKLK